MLRMLYSCTRMVTVGVKGLTVTHRDGSKHIHAVVRKLFDLVMRQVQMQKSTKLAEAVGQRRDVVVRQDEVLEQRQRRGQFHRQRVELVV